MLFTYTSICTIQGCCISISGSQRSKITAEEPILVRGSLIICLLTAVIQHTIVKGNSYKRIAYLRLQKPGRSQQNAPSYVINNKYLLVVLGVREQERANTNLGILKRRVSFTHDVLSAIKLLVTYLLHGTESFLRS